MPEVRVRDGGIFLDGLVAATTDATTGPRWVLDKPVQFWGLQVIDSGSTSIVVTLDVSVATSSDAVTTELLRWASSSQASGDTLWSTEALAMLVQVTLVTAATSAGGAADAWIVGR